MNPERVLLWFTLAAMCILTFTFAIDGDVGSAVTAASVVLLCVVMLRGRRQ